MSVALSFVASRMGLLASGSLVLVVMFRRGEGTYLYFRWNPSGSKEVMQQIVMERLRYFRHLVDVVISQQVLLYLLLHGTSQKDVSSAPTDMSEEKKNRCIHSRPSSSFSATQTLSHFPSTRPCFPPLLPSLSTAKPCNNTSTCINTLPYLTASCAAAE